MKVPFYIQQPQKECLLTAGAPIVFPPYPGVLIRALSYTRYPLLHLVRPMEYLLTSGVPIKAHLYADVPILMPSFVRCPHILSPLDQVTSSEYYLIPDIPIRVPLYIQVCLLKSGVHIFQIMSSSEFPLKSGVPIGVHPHHSTLHIPKEPSNICIVECQHNGLL